MTSVQAVYVPERLNTIRSYQRADSLRRSTGKNYYREISFAPVQSYVGIDFRGKGQFATGSPAVTI